MKRWQYTPSNGQLRISEINRPMPGPGEALVKVKAVSLNYRDAAILDGAMPAGPDGLLVPGSDMCGEIVSLGPYTRRFPIGASVISADTMNWIDGPAPPRETNSVPILGRLAEYVTVREESLIASPESLSCLEASTLPVAGLTAWFALIELGRVKAGDTVVVQGTGGVALFALQFAKAHGARVISVTSSDEKINRVRSLGAAEGINRNNLPEWDRRVLDLTGGMGAQHIIEMTGGHNVSRSVSALAFGGRISLIGVLGETEMHAPILPILYKRAQLIGIGVGHRRAQEDMVRAIDSLKIRPVIDAVYSFADTVEAFAHLRRGPFGKVVVVFPEP